MGANNMEILIAEDDRDIALVYRLALKDRNHHPTLTDNGEDCLTIYRQELKNFVSRMGSIDNNKLHIFDMVILDYRMPGTNGIKVAKEIIKINPKQRIIIASSYPRETLFYSMKELGQLVELVQKPFNIHMLIDAIENKQFYSELQRLNQDAATQEFNLPKHEQLSDLPEIMLSSKYSSKKIEGNE
jgi:DNA-binding NtrC family response regulator